MTTSSIWTCVEGRLLFCPLLSKLIDLFLMTLIWNVASWNWVFLMTTFSSRTQSRAPNLFKEYQFWIVYSKQYKRNGCFQRIRNISHFVFFVMLCKKNKYLWSIYAYKHTFTPSHKNGLWNWPGKIQSDEKTWGTQLIRMFFLTPPVFFFFYNKTYFFLLKEESFLFILRGRMSGSL